MFLEWSKRKEAQESDSLWVSSFERAFIAIEEKMECTVVSLKSENFLLRGVRPLMIRYGSTVFVISITGSSGGNGQKPQGFIKCITLFGRDRLL